ncbi:MAG TPA: hypothetical protein VMB19_08095 [Silvibacterium sp.]|nr:hypothetical protein [Silvibacterium sp.]
MGEVKYLITVNSETGVIARIEKLGQSGEVTPVDLSKLSIDLSGVGGAAIVVNIYNSGAAVEQKGAVNTVKLTDGEDFCICFPPPKPPGRAR